MVRQIWLKNEQLRSLGEGYVRVICIIPAFFYEFETISR